MRIVEQSRDRMIVKQSGWLHRFFTTFGVLVGLAIVVWGSGIGDDPVWLPRTVGSLIAAVGRFFRILCADMTLTLDRQSGMAQVEWVQFFGTRTNAVRLDDIINLVTEGDDEAERLVFRVKAGESVPLHPFLITGGDHPEVQTAIKAWLAGRA